MFPCLLKTRVRSCVDYLLLCVGGDCGGARVRCVLGVTAEAFHRSSVLWETCGDITAAVSSPLFFFFQLLDPMSR